MTKSSQIKDDKSSAFQRWDGCYDLGWNGFITADSFSHPAKYSRGLIEHIYDYMILRGWISKNDLVADCFSGVGTGGIVAAYRGLRWIGVELEPRFVGFARDNFKLHRNKLEYLGCPLPKIVQGDSRRFHQIVGEACAIVTSPPFGEKTTGGPMAHNGDTSLSRGGKQMGRSSLARRLDEPGQIEGLPSGDLSAVITSPPYAQTAVEKSSDGVDMAKNWETYKASGGGSSFESYKATQEKHSQGYGKTNGQIAALKSGPVSAVITSPPYSDIAAGAGGLNTKPATKPGQQSGRSAKAASQDTDQQYGQTEGQISQLKGGSVDSIVSLPPYADSVHDGNGIDQSKLTGNKPGKNTQAKAEGYGAAAGQIGKLAGGNVDAIYTSPPWEKNCEGGVKANRIRNSPTEGKGHYASPAARKAQMERDEQKVYGDSKGQIGKESGPTYWSEMFKVYSSCFLAIKPGGYMAVVVKDYCRDKKRVRLCDDTLRLLEHIGFTPVDRIHAMLTKTQVENGLFENIKTTKSKKSFFRRLYESDIPEGDERRIDHEEVLVVRKPI